MTNEQVTLNESVEPQSLTKDFLELYRQDISFELKKNENAELPNFSEWKEKNSELLT